MQLINSPFFAIHQVFALLLFAFFTILSCQVKNGSGAISFSRRAALTAFPWERSRKRGSQTEFQAPFPPRLASQAAWYRMENGPKAKKTDQKIENSPTPEMGKTWPKNGEKKKNYLISQFLPFLGHVFPISGRGLFLLFFSQFLPIFGFWPVFHCIPGDLTRNPRLPLTCLHYLSFLAFRQRSCNPRGSVQERPPGLI